MKIIDVKKNLQESEIIMQNIIDDMLPYITKLDYIIDIDKNSATITHTIPREKVTWLGKSYDTYPLIELHQTAIYSAHDGLTARYWRNSKRKKEYIKQFKDVLKKYDKYVDRLTIWDII